MERVPAPVTEKSRVIKEARGLFRKSLAVNLIGVLTVEDFSKFEQWFINRTVESYDRSKGRRWLADQATMINYSVFESLDNLYCEGYVSLSETIMAWHKNRSARILSSLEREIERAERVVMEAPEKIREMEEFNQRLALAYGNTVGSVIRRVSEGVGVAVGGSVVAVGAVSGLVGYTAGSMSRRFGQGVIEAVRSWKR